jgi:hypothetical protein
METPTQSPAGGAKVPTDMRPKLEQKTPTRNAAQQKPTSRADVFNAKDTLLQTYVKETIQKTNFVRLRNQLR